MLFVPSIVVPSAIYYRRRHASTYLLSVRRINNFVTVCGKFSLNTCFSISLFVVAEGCPMCTKASHAVHIPAGLVNNGFGSMILDGGAEISIIILYHCQSLAELKDNILMFKKVVHIIDL